MLAVLRGVACAPDASELGTASPAGVLEHLLAMHPDAGHPSPPHAATHASSLPRPPPHQQVLVQHAGHVHELLGQRGLVLQQHVVRQQRGDVQGAGGSLLQPEQQAAGLRGGGSTICLLGTGASLVEGCMLLSCRLPTAVPVSSSSWLVQECLAEVAS